MPNKSKKVRAESEAVIPNAPQHAPEKPRFNLSSAPRMKHVYVALALFLVTLAAYSNSFRAELSLDNVPLILQDARVHAATSENISQIVNRPAWFMPPEKGLYRPLTTFSYLFNYAIAGNEDRPFGYHLVNFAIHFLNVLLCYALALSVLRKFWPAVFVAALWAVHPVLTESITNVIGRADLLAAFGVLSGLWMYRMSREAQGARRFALLFGLATATAIGIFSKESAIVIVALIALWEITWWKDGSRLRSLAYGMIAAALPIVAFLIQRALVLSRSTVPVFPYVDNPLIGSGFIVARLTAVKILAKYLWMLIWPAKLSWNYYYAEIPMSRGTLQDWIAWIVIAVLFIGVCFAFRRNRAVFFFAAFAFIAIIPTSNLIVLIGSIMADRFLYLPAIGFAACIVIGAFALGERFKSRAVAPILLCIVIAAFGIRTWSRNLDWFSTSSLLEAAVRDTPKSFASHFGLGTQLYLSGGKRENLDRAISEAEKSLAILDPLSDARNFADAYANAGTYYQVRGDLGLAATGNQRQQRLYESYKDYHRAIEILLRGASVMKAYDLQIRAREMARGKSDSEIPHVGSKSLYPELAICYLRLGDTQNAIDAIQHALMIDPEQAQIFVTQAHILLAQHKNDEAAVALVESYMSSGDGQVLVPLAELYRGGLDPKGCAISQSAGGIALNTFCATVHEHICRAKAELIRVYAQANRGDLIADLKSQSASDASCGGSAQK